MGVAIVRGKSHAAYIHYQKQCETRYEFIIRVMESYKYNIDSRNTLTVEFVWNIDD